MRRTSAIESSEIALADAWRVIVGLSAFRTDYPRYLCDPNLNIIEGVSQSVFEQDFDGAAGHEFREVGAKPPKFCAAYSSAALCANSFAIYKSHPSVLRLLGRSGFDSPKFEARCDTDLTRNHRRRTPPTLDVLLQTSETVIGIESKCTEYLTEKKHQSKPLFSKSYGKLENQLEGGWATLYDLLGDDRSHFKYLDAAQLVKHYFGLRAKFAPKRTTLLYVYWQPANPDEFQEFARHRSEITEFADLVKGASLKFEHISYADLWTQWECNASPNSPVRDHVARLRARYQVTLASQRDARA